MHHACSSPTTILSGICNRQSRRPYRSVVAATLATGLDGSIRLRNHSIVRHSSLNLPLKLSFVPLCLGFPGSMNTVSVRASHAEPSSRALTNLARYATECIGAPLRARWSVSPVPRSRDVRGLSRLRRWRGTHACIVDHGQSLDPFPAQASNTKSSLHRAFLANGIGTRGRLLASRCRRRSSAPVGRLAPPIAHNAHRRPRAAAASSTSPRSAAPPRSVRRVKSTRSLAKTVQFIHTVTRSLGPPVPF